MRRTIGVLIWITVLSSCVPTEPTGVPSASPRGPTSSPAPRVPDQHPTWSVRTNQRLGIALQVPPRWSLVWNPLRDGTIGDIFVAGSWRFPKLPECGPVPPGQALLSLSEVAPVIASTDYSPEQLERDLPPRPRRFETGVLRSLGVRNDCDQPKAQLFRFRDADEFLYAWVMFGRDLPTGVRTKAEVVLSILVVDPTGAV